MVVEAYFMNEELIKVNKTITNKRTFNGYFRDGSDLVRPTLMLELNGTISRNYFYIPELKRYYFVKSFKMVRTGLFQVELEVDVLMSYATEIKALTCVIARQEKPENFNLFLDDPEFKAYNYTRVQTKEFESGFTQNPEYVLIVAGGY